MNNPVHIGILILVLSKILMYGFWRDYVKRKYAEKSEIVLYGYRYFHCIRKNA